MSRILMSVLVACGLLSIRAVSVVATAGECAAGTVVHNHSGCTAAGHYLATTTITAADCCALCANQSACQAWSFHGSSAAISPCYLASNPKVSTTPDTMNTTCGCRNANCKQGPPPPTPPIPCVPVPRPAKPTPTPLPPGQKQPHIITILVDDLGFDDSSIRRGNAKNISYTPHMQALAQEGITLDRHHTYLWCSPTRRSFLTGRFPVHITGTQAPTCSNLTPLQFTILSEKLAAVGYESHFVGKGHLGWWTVDHLMVNRGFNSHLGFLGGGESYIHGEATRCGDGGTHDMWENEGPALDLIDSDFYNTNFFTTAAVQRVNQHNTSKPFWLHLTHQAVHTGDHRSPPVWELWPTDLKKDYVSCLFVLDNGIANLTQALKAAGMWDNTVFFLTADNGGDCGLPAQGGHGGAPGFASNFPLLGRKCTAWDGGTRTAAFVAGGLIPPALRGTTNAGLFYITDWYPTLSKLAGVDPTDDWADANGTIHPIDGVDIWPTLMSGGSEPVGREWLPTTERSLLWTDGNGHMYKLIIDEKKANRFYENGTQYMDTSNPCIPGAIGYTPQFDGLGVPDSCTVCSATDPCLFDVLLDPSEVKNLAKSLPDVATKMAAKLATFTPYIPTLSPDNLGCYTCGQGSDAPPHLFWQGFSGPCCVHKNTSIV